MNRLVLMLVIALGFALWSPLQAQDFSEVEIQATDLGDGIYMLQGAGGNIGLSIGDDGVFMIDDQYAPLSEKIEAAVAALTDQPIRFIINTHWHFDHTGGNEHFGEGGAAVIAHHNVRERMQNGQVLEPFGVQIDASPDAALPIVTFAEGMTFHMNGQTIEVFHTERAHTDGDAMILFQPANVLHMGDVYFAGRFPFIDSSSGGSARGYIRVIDQILARIDDDTRIIPGHGAMSNKAELQAHRDVLAEIIDAVAALMAEGHSLEEIQAANPAAKYAESYGQFFIKPDIFIQLVHASLSADP